MIAIEMEGLTKDFGALRAVNDLDLVIEESAIFSLLGPNGAGKTTTVRMLTGLLRPTIGGAKVLGLDIAELNQNSLPNYLMCH